MGFESFTFGHLSAKGVWYVVDESSDTIEESITKRDELRKQKAFKDSWLLTMTE